MKKDFFLFSGIKILNMFLVLYVLGIISRKLDLESFGNYSLIQSFINLIIGFLFSWSSSLILFFGVKEKTNQGDMSKIIWIRNKILLCSFSILTFVFFCFYRNINEYLKINIVLIYLFIIFKVLNDYTSIYLLSIKKKIESAFLQFFLRSILGIYITFFSLTLNKLIIVSLIIEISGILFIYFVDSKDFKKSEIVDKQLKKEIKFFLMWQFFGFLGLSLTNYGDNFIIKLLYSFEEIGIYNRAYTFFLGMDSIIGVVTSYMNPDIISSIVKKDKRKIKKFFEIDRYFIFLIFSIVNLILVILSPIIFGVLYKENIEEIILLFRILSIGSIVRVWLYLYNAIFNISNNFKYLQMLNIFRGILNVLFSYILIKRFGVIGAAYATLITLLLMALLLIKKGEKIIKELKNQLDI